MGAVNLATIRDIVRFRGDYPVGTKFSNANVNTEIQTSWSELYELIEEVNEGWWDKDSTVSTVANQAYVALPADCWKVKAVDVLDGSEYDELDQVGIGDRNKYGSEKDRPSAFRTSARGIELYPTPDAIYTIRVTYTPIVTALHESNTTQMYNDWHDYIVASTLVKLGEREQRDVSTHVALLDRIAARIRTGASRRRQQEPEYLQLREVHSFAGEEWD